MRSAIDNTIEYMRQLAQQLEYCGVSNVVLIVLMKLGIPTNYDGFEYLRVAILLRYENPLSTMVNDVYPELRKLYGNYMTNQQIEMAMRGAIQVGWKRTDTYIWKLMFPTILSGEDRKPSNTEFIDELARIVEMLCSCAEAYALRHSREEVGCGNR